jgi:hypothetical protein
LVDQRLRDIQLLRSYRSYGGLAAFFRFRDRWVHNLTGGYIMDESKHLGRT